MRPWTYSAGAEVHDSLSLGQVPGREDPVLYMGDFSATVHAIDASDGSLVWRASVGDHPDATITGSPKLHDGSLYVPISSSEWATAADPGYACCTFRGGVVSVDAASGELNWRAHVIDKPAAETGETNPFGAARKGPAGAPVWNSPTIDAERGVLYVGTGEAYTSPAADTSDAVLAFSLATGERQWAKQLLGGDAWNMACFIGEGRQLRRRMALISTSVLQQYCGLVRRDYLLVGQKSGDVYALDPDNGGAVVWHSKVGRGGFLGGVHWGMSVNDDSLFVPIADTTITGRFSGPVFPGVHALDPTSGANVGTHPASLIARASHRFQSVIKACPPRLPVQISWYSRGLWTAISKLTTASLERLSGHSIPMENLSRCLARWRWAAPSSQMAPFSIRGMSL